MKLDLSRWKEVCKRYQGVLLVIFVGILLMLLPGERPRTSAEKECGEQLFSLEEFESRLSKVLSRVDGAGEVTVILTLKNGGCQVFAQDIERDGVGGSSRTVTVEGTAGEEPVVLQTITPQFQGALVVCPGGEDPAVKLQLCRAVSALTGLGSDRISVCKSK